MRPDQVVPTPAELAERMRSRALSSVEVVNAFLERIEAVNPGLNAIVTEASAGIGEAIVRTFVKHGATVLAVDAAASGIDTRFRNVRNVRGVAMDLTRADAATLLVDAAKTELGGLDILVNNFDWQTESPLNDSDEAECERLLKIVTERMSAFCHAAMQPMQKSPAGRMINIGCVRSVFGVEGEGAYAKSQAAIASLTSALAAKSGEFGITVNYIQPGAVMTPVSRRIFAADKDLRDRCIRSSAARRLGEPVDIAKVALFLATDDSVFVSGTGIVADGGSARPV